MTRFLNTTQRTTNRKETPMKKIVLSLAALGALSTAAFASYRDVTTVTGNQDVPPFTAASSTTVEPLMAIKLHTAPATLTAYQWLLINSEEPGSSTR